MDVEEIRLLRACFLSNISFSIQSLFQNMLRDHVPFYTYNIGSHRHNAYAEVGEHPDVSRLIEGHSKIFPIKKQEKIKSARKTIVVSHTDIYAMTCCERLILMTLQELGFNLLVPMQNGEQPITFVNLPRICYDPIGTTIVNVPQQDVRQQTKSYPYVERKVIDEALRASKTWRHLVHIYPLTEEKMQTLTLGLFTLKSEKKVADKPSCPMIDLTCERGSKYRYLKGLQDRLDRGSFKQTFQLCLTEAQCCPDDTDAPLIRHLAGEAAHVVIRLSDSEGPSAEQLERLDAMIQRVTKRLSPGTCSLFVAPNHRNSTVLNNYVTHRPVQLVENKASFILFARKKRVEIGEQRLDSYDQTIFEEEQANKLDTLTPETKVLRLCIALSGRASDMGHLKFICKLDAGIFYRSIRQVPPHLKKLSFQLEQSAGYEQAMLFLLQASYAAPHLQEISIIYQKRNYRISQDSVRAIQVEKNELNRAGIIHGIFKQLKRLNTQTCETSKQAMCAPNAQIEQSNVLIPTEEESEAAKSVPKPITFYIKYITDNGVEQLLHPSAYCEQFFTGFAFDEKEERLTACAYQPKKLHMPQWRGAMKGAQWRVSFSTVLTIKWIVLPTPMRQEGMRFTLSKPAIFDTRTGMLLENAIVMFGYDRTLWRMCVRLKGKVPPRKLTFCYNIVQEALEEKERFKGQSQIIQASVPETFFNELEALLLLHTVKNERLFYAIDLPLSVRLILGMLEKGKEEDVRHPNFAGLRPRPSGRTERGRDPHCVALPGALHSRGSGGGANLLLTSGQSQIDNHIASEEKRKAMYLWFEQLIIRQVRLFGGATPKTHQTFEAVGQILACFKGSEKIRAFSEQWGHSSLFLRSLFFAHPNCLRRSLVYFVLVHYMQKKLEWVEPVFMVNNVCHSMIENARGTENLGGEPAFNWVHRVPVDLKKKAALLKDVMAAQQKESMVMQEKKRMRAEREKPWKAYQAAMQSPAVLRAVTSRKAWNSVLLRCAEEKGKHSIWQLPKGGAALCYQVLAKHQDTCIIYIDHPETLTSLRAISVQYGLKGVKRCQLQTLLDDAKQRGKQVVILIRWNAFSAIEQVHLKSIADVKPQLGGIDIPDTVSIIHCVDDGKEVVDMPQATLSRFCVHDARATFERINKKEAKEERDEKEEKSTQEDIDLYGDENWFSEEVVGVKFGKEGITLQIGRLLRAMQEGGRVRLIDPPQDLPAFDRLVKAIDRGIPLVRVEDRWVKVHETFSLQCVVLPTDKITFGQSVRIGRILSFPEPLKEDENVCRFYVNAQNVATLWREMTLQKKHAKDAKEHIFYEKNRGALRIQHQKQPKATLQLIITESLSHAQWRRLEQHCSQHLKQAMIQIDVLEGIALPQAIEAQLVEETTSFSDQPLFAQTLAIHYATDPDAVLEAWEQRGDTLVLLITPNTTYTDLMPGFCLQDKEEKDVALGWDRLVRSKGALFELLKAGRDIILVGQASEVLLQGLVGLLNGERQIYFNGAYQSIRGRLRVLIPSDGLQPASNLLCQSFASHEACEEVGLDEKREMPSGLSYLFDFIRKHRMRWGDRPFSLNKRRQAACRQALEGDHCLQPYLSEYAKGTEAYAELNGLCQLLFSDDNALYVRQRAWEHFYETQDTLTFDNIYRFVHSFSPAALKEQLLLKESSTAKERRVAFEALRTDPRMFKRINKIFLKGSKDTAPCTMKPPRADAYQTCQMRMMEHLHQGRVVLLLGPPGTGKTHSVLRMPFDSAIQSGYLTRRGDSQKQPEQSTPVKQYTVTEDVNKKKDGIKDFLLEKDPAMLVIDEATMQPDGTWDFLAPLWRVEPGECVPILYNGTIYFVSNPEQKWVVMTSNPDDYPQVNRHRLLSEDVPTVWFNPFSEQEKRVILKKKMPDLEDDALYKRMVRLHQTVEEDRAIGDVSLRDLFFIATRYQQGIKPFKACDGDRALHTLILADVVWEAFSYLWLTERTRNALSDKIAHILFDGKAKYDEEARISGRLARYRLINASNSNASPMPIHLTWQPPSARWACVQWQMWHFLQGHCGGNVLLLEGPPGIGKSMLAEELMHVAKKGKKPSHRFKDVQALLDQAEAIEKGRCIANPSYYIQLNTDEGVSMVLEKAMQHGFSVLLDEVNLYPTLTHTLLQLFDTNDKVHPYFRCILTQNTSSQHVGRSALSKALLNRCIVMILDHYDEKELLALLNVFDARCVFDDKKRKALINAFPKDRTPRDLKRFQEYFQQQIISKASNFFRMNAQPSQTVESLCIQSFPSSSQVNEPPV